MRRFSAAVRLSLLVFLVALLCSATTGCALFESPNKAFVTGVDAGVNGSGMADEYLNYVANDPKLSADGKKIKAGTVSELRTLIKNAKGK